MQIKLPCGRITLIDDSDIGLLAGRNWHSDVRKHTVYVRGRRKGERGNSVYLHKIITENQSTDHRDGDGLNNRRSNLRICTQAENCLNSSKKRDHKKYKGVYFDARRNRWYSQLYINRKSYFGGYHNSQEDAARAYDAMAIEHHRSFALLNYPQDYFSQHKK